MPTLKMTTKRQVTFPAATCQELGVGPGAEILLERKTLKNGRTAWVLQTHEAPPTPWFGSLQNYATGKKHDLNDIRRSIAQGRAREVS